MGEFYIQNKPAKSLVASCAELHRTCSGDAGNRRKTSYNTVAPFVQPREGHRNSTHGETWFLIEV